jgi:hypothetical protein
MGGSKMSKKQKDKRMGGSKMTKKQKDARKLYGMGGSKMSKKQKDKRMGGSKMTKKQREKQKDHRMGGSKMNKTQKKSQFGGDDPKRIDWQTVLVEVVRSNSRPMKIKDIVIEVQKRAKAEGKTVPGWTSFENKFKRCKPGTKGKGKRKFQYAWIDQKFSVNTRNKPKKEWVVKLKI